MKSKVRVHRFHCYCIFIVKFHILMRKIALYPLYVHEMCEQCVYKCKVRHDNETICEEIKDEVHLQSTFSKPLPVDGPRYIFHKIQL